MARRFIPNRERRCLFCHNKIEPNYKVPDILQRFLTDRGKIMSRRITRVCAKHQRKLSSSIKRARILGFLPFVADNVNR